LRYYRTTGLTLTQMQELVRRVNEVLDEPWNKRTGRPKSLGLYKAVEAACVYLHWRSVMDRAWRKFVVVSSGSGDVAWLLLRCGAGFCAG